MANKKDHGTEYIGELIASAATRTAPIKCGTTLPATCAVGDMFVKTDATSTAVLYVCLSTNVWTQQTGSGGSSSFEYPIATEVHFFDDFTHPSTTTATMGWVYANGSLAIQAAEANHHGLLRRSTGAGGSGVVAYMSRAAGNNQMFLPADNFNVKWLVRINTDFNQTVRIGINCGAISAAQPAAGAYFECVNSGNWFAVNRTGNVETGTNQDTTVDMATATWYLLGIRRSGSNLIFSINGTDRITQSGNMPTAVGTLWAMITNSAVEDKSMDLDAVSLDITGLTRY